MGAGGFSVPAALKHGLAVLCSPEKHTFFKEEVNSENLPNFVYEILRFYICVNGFPYYTDSSQKHRRVLILAACSRDKKAWGQDADEFKLRDLETYQKLSCFWADKAVDTKKPENNRACPAKDLSFQMILNFLKAFLDKRSQFFFDPDDIKISQDVNPAGIPKTLKLPPKFDTTDQEVIPGE